MNDQLFADPRSDALDWAAPRVISITEMGAFLAGRNPLPRGRSGLHRGFDFDSKGLTVRWEDQTYVYTITELRNWYRNWMRRLLEL